jgi:hypothetical protein
MLCLHSGIASSLPGNSFDLNRDRLGRKRGTNTLGKKPLDMFDLPRFRGERQNSDGFPVVLNTTHRLGQQKNARVLTSE